MQAKRRVFEIKRQADGSKAGKGPRKRGIGEDDPDNPSGRHLLPLCAAFPSCVTMCCFSACLLHGASADSCALHFRLVTAASAIGSVRPCSWQCMQHCGPPLNAAGLTAGESFTAVPVLEEMPKWQAVMQLVQVGFLALLCADAALASAMNSPCNPPCLLLQALAP